MKLAVVDYLPSGPGRTRHFWLKLALLIALSGNLFPVGRAVGQTAKEAADPGATKAARDYLYALAKGDKVTLQSLTPDKLENYYGPSLFAEIPLLTNPRVIGHRALVDFEAKSTDPDLPKQGTLSLVLKDSRTADRWVMRGIFWKGSSSLTLNPFKYSETPADRSQEPAVKTCALKYLRAWQAKDWQTMQFMTYDWLDRKRPLKGDAIIRSMELKGSCRADGSVRVEFTASVSPRFPIIKVFRKTVRGHIYTVKEGGVWKVRGMLVSI
jgi:hypothetical protein